MGEHIISIQQFFSMPSASKFQNLKRAREDGHFSFERGKLTFDLGYSLV